MSEPITSESSRKLLTAAIWVAIGALVAAAIVCVIWVLVGSDSGIIGRAFLTVLLLACFAGVAILDTRLAPGRPAWFALLSMVSWVAILLIGVFKIWVPGRDDEGWGAYVSGPGRFSEFLLVILVIQLAVLHVRLHIKAMQRNPIAFVKVTATVTVALVAVLAVMLVIPLTLGDLVRFDSLYWRIIVAVAILAAVGTALVPLVNALLAPNRDQPRASAGGAYPPATGGWPTYYDGRTPLPALPDGSPDWNAYYTGQPTVAPPTPPQAPPAPAAPTGPPSGYGQPTPQPPYDAHAPYATPQRGADGTYRAAGGPSATEPPARPDFPPPAH